MFSDHPYTRGVFDGIDVDMVPCYRVGSTEHLRSAVDRTPFHTRFVKANLTPEGCDQVRLIKTFLKGIGAYGAEQDSRGFSGYLCEILVVRFGSFRGVLEAAAGWSPGATVEVAGRGPRMVSPLVVYDPVDSRRNVASAVHEDTLALFIHASREYLAEPRREFFFPNPGRPRPRDELREEAERTGVRLLTVEFPRPDAIEDNLWSQLWKTQYALRRQLDSYSFATLRAVHTMDGSRMSVAFELERDEAPAVVRHAGPPVWADAGRFLERWSGNPNGEPFIEDGVWTVVADRRYRTAKDLILGEACRAGVGRDLDCSCLRVLDHDETLSEADPLLLTELLEPMFPWERPARQCYLMNRSSNATRARGLAWYTCGFGSHRLRFESGRAHFIVHGVDEGIRTSKSNRMSSNNLQGIQTSAVGRSQQCHMTVISRHRCNMEIQKIN